MPDEFFTLQSMVTLAGATGATLVVANGIQLAFNFNPKWLALFIAELITITGMIATRPEGAGLAFSDVFVAVINGFLVFCTAAGSSQMVASPSPQEAVARTVDSVEPAPLAPTARRGFFTSWFC